jgi:carboxymethylenebutenolidase
MWDPQSNQLMHMVRYCFGGAIAGRLGSTEFLNTIVIAHPSNLKGAQIRAIKVNPTSNSLSVS